MADHVSPITLQSPNGFGPSTSDNAPQVVHTYQDPEVVSSQYSHDAPEPTYGHSNWALPAMAPAREPPEPAYLQHGSTFGTTISSQTPPIDSEKRDASPSPKVPWWKRPASVPFIVLSVLAILVVAGLAAGIGVVATQKNKSSNNNDSSTSPSSTNYNNITMDCSDRKGNGTSYSSPIVNQGKDTEVPSVKFELSCWGIANTGQLLSLFTPDFQGCMDACASWNAPISASNGTDCHYVTFVPSWTDYSTAKGNNAPGDCYLAPKMDTDKGIGHDTGIDNSDGFERHVGIVVK